MAQKLASRLNIKSCLDSEQTTKDMFKEINSFYHRKLTNCHIICSLIIKVFRETNRDIKKLLFKRHNTYLYAYVNY